MINFPRLITAYLPSLLFSVSPHYLPLTIHSLFFPSTKVQASQVYPSAMAYEVAERLGISSPVKAGQGKSAGERVPKGGNRDRDRHPDSFPLHQESHKRTKPYTCNICAECSGQSYASSLVGDSVSMSPGQLTLRIFPWCPWPFWMP